MNCPRSRPRIFTLTQRKKVRDVFEQFRVSDEDIQKQYPVTFDKLSTWVRIRSTHVISYRRACIGESVEHLTQRHPVLHEIRLDLVIAWLMDGICARTWMGHGHG